jgi:hypothetical protein
MTPSGAGQSLSNPFKSRGAETSGLPGLICTSSNHRDWVQSKDEPNIRPLEPHFSLMRQAFELIDSGSYKLAECLREMTKRGLPLIWHKTADQILDAVVRFCTRTLETGH